MAQRLYVWLMNCSSTSGQLHAFSYGDLLSEDNDLGKKPQTTEKQHSYTAR